MLDFIWAALPWVLIGVSVAVILVHYSKKSVKEDGKKQKEDHLPVCMCVGMCIGTALGATSIVPLAHGISFGMLAGIVAGILLKKQEKNGG